jgi:hypothetical protein
MVITTRPSPSLPLDMTSSKPGTSVGDVQNSLIRMSAGMPACGLSIRRGLFGEDYSTTTVSWWRAAGVPLHRGDMPVWISRSEQFSSSVTVSRTVKVPARG